MNQYYVGNTNNDAPHYVFSPVSCHFLPRRPKRLPHMTPSSYVLPLTYTPSFTPIQINNFYVYFNLHIIRQRTVRQRFCTEWQQAFPEFSLPLILPSMQFLFVCLFVCVVPKAETSSKAYQRAVLTVLMSIPNNSHTECLGHKFWNISRLQPPHCDILTPALAHPFASHRLWPCPTGSAIRLRSSPTALRLASLLSWNQEI
jgi:hypothetical protein